MIQGASILFAIAHFVAAILLCFRKEWVAVGVGLGWLFLWPVTISFTMLIQAAIAFLLVGTLKVFGRIITIPAAMIASLLFPTVLLSWGLFVAWLWPKLGSESSRNLLLFWSFGCSVCPWIIAFMKSYNPKDPSTFKQAGHIAGFLFGYGLAALALIFWTKSLFVAALIIGAAMLPSTVMEMWANVLSAWSQRQ